MTVRVKITAADIRAARAACRSAGGHWRSDCPTARAAARAFGLGAHEWAEVRPDGYDGAGPLELCLWRGGAWAPLELSAVGGGHVNSGAH